MVVAAVASAHRYYVSIPLSIALSGNSVTLLRSMYPYSGKRGCHGCIK